MNVTFLRAFDASDKVDVGDRLFLRPEPENPKDHQAIAVYTSDGADGEKVGYLSASVRTSLEGTKNAHQIFDEVSKHGANIKLIAESKITTSKATMTAYVAELFYIYQKPQQKAGESKSFDLLIEGATVRHRLKSQVATAIMSQQDIALYLEMNGSTISVHQPGIAGTAGVVSDKNPDELVKQVEAMLRKKNVLNVKPTGQIQQERSSTNYYVSVEVNEDSLADFGAEISRLTAECICTQEVASDKIDFMMASGFPNNLIKAVLNANRYYPPEDAVNIPCPDVKYVQATGNNLARCVGYMLTGRNIRTFGPKGGGKNTMAETALYLLGRPMYRLSVSGDIDKFDMLGGPALRGGETTTEISDMLKCLQAGYCVIFDEANAARPEVLEVIHSLTDSARSIQVPGYGLVKMHEDALVCMTMNEGYVGCGEMNAATVDRFVPIKVEPEANIKELLKHMVPTITKEQLDVCCKIHAAILQGIGQGKYSPDAISLRGFKDALVTCEFVSLNQGLIDNIACKSQDPDERNSLTSLINDFTGVLFN